jgi:hypothetical protein
MSNQNHPFEIGTEVIQTKYHHGRLVLGSRAYVAKRYANGNVKLKFKHNHKELGAQFNVRCSGGHSGLEKRWYLSQAGRCYYGASFELATSELLERAQADAVKRRAVEVAMYLSSELLSRKNSMTPDQLARINAIMNEETA